MKGIYRIQIYYITSAILWLLSFNAALATAPKEAESANSNPYNLEESINAAFDFLYNQMDQFHRKTFIYDEPDANSYYPSGYMGAYEALDVDIYDSSEPEFGLTSMRIEYNFSNDVRHDWAGIFFQYPNNNWGDLPGRDLTGAKELSFWVKAENETKAKFKIGGINRFPHHDPSKSYSDSIDSIWASENSQNSIDPYQDVTIRQDWKKHTIDLREHNLQSVIGGFALIINHDHKNPKNSIYLDNVSIDLPRLDKPRFIQSYVTQEYTDKNYATNAAHTYDQALVILALMARGEKEDIKRAELLADALLIAQNKDRCFNDGRLRNAYASGDLLETASIQSEGEICKTESSSITEVTRLPGRWNKEKSLFEEDEYAVGNDVGNMSWAAIALIQAGTLPLVGKYISEEKRKTYIDAATQIAEWIIKEHKISNGDEFGGFRGGYQNTCGQYNEKVGFPISSWRSAEHNIDLYVLFKHLSNLYKKESKAHAKWELEAKHALNFIKKLWNHQEKYFKVGTSPGDNKLPRTNDDIIALDVQTWALLALNEVMPTETTQALNWTLKHCKSKDEKYGYDFNCRDGDGAWWEGTAQVALALSQNDASKKSKPILKRLMEVQEEPRLNADGAIYSTNKDKLTTGIDKCDSPWTYPKEPHIGATAWYLFAALNKNPYYLEKQP